MATESKKSLVGRISDKVIDRLVDWLSGFVGLALLGWTVFARHWLAGELACISKPLCEVSGNSLGVLIAFTLVTTGAAIVFGWLWYRIWRKLRSVAAQPETTPKSVTPQFHDIEVEDKRLNLRWYIRRPPREWLHWRNIHRTVSSNAVQQVLDGPFHAAPACNAPLAEIPLTGLINEITTQSPNFGEKCSHCGLRVFQGSTAFGVSVWPVRAYALEELQRMQRNGTKLPEAQWSPPIVLENPEYWKLMLPPPAPVTSGPTG